MAKLKSPFLAFKAAGSLGKLISLRPRGRQTIAESKPIPPDAKSPAQLSWRHMYQKATALWHALSAAEKQEWEANARPKHMTGYAWFMSQCLKPNPGIYLPLQGGTMTGTIALASGTNLKLVSSLTVNDTWTGLSALGPAGEIEALGQAVYLKGADSRVWKALATGVATMPAIALATCATTAGNTFEYLLLGFMRHDAWNWTPGGLLYVSRAAFGALTQTLPSTSGDQVQVVGIAVTADIILFNPSYELVEIS